MSLEIPQSAAEVENRSKADIQNELPESNPFLKNNWLLALVASSANRIFDFYLQLIGAIRDNFPDTALGAELDRWLAIHGKSRLPATKANGNVVATGTSGGVIALGTALTISTGNYITTSSVTIFAQNISIKTLIRSGQTATATTTSPHNFANNVIPVITGADQTEYNIAANITVTGLDTFEYQIDGAPITPATGIITAASTFASVPVEAIDFGIVGNLSAGAELKLQSPLVNVDDTLAVDFGDIGGGSDQEGPESARARMLFKIQNPVAHFNSSDIINKAKEVPGVTRVFVQEAGTIIATVPVTSITRVGNIASATLATPEDLQTGQAITFTGADQADYNVIDKPMLKESGTLLHYIVPNMPTTPATGTINATTSVPIGQVRLFFMRDNDINPIPSGSEVAKVRTKLEEIVPANTDKNNDLLIFSPVANTIDFTFSELTPNTITMKTAIVANLKQFFEENTDIGVDINVNAYICAIFNTVDTKTGNIVKSFTLDTPTGNIVIASNSIGVLGSVLFNV